MTDRQTTGRRQTNVKLRSPKNERWPGILIDSYTGWATVAQAVYESINNNPKVFGSLTTKESAHNIKTRSYVVAERPRDASCLSVVSFNVTIPREHYSVVSYFGFRFTTVYKCCSVVFGITFKFLVINTSSSVSRHQ